MHVKTISTLALAGVIGATLVAPALAEASPVRYDSTPEAGTVSIPSMGPEAYAFNRIGNEVIIPHVKPIKHVSVTMVSWACENGSWTSGCVTTPGAKFPATIKLTLQRFARVNPLTKVIEPGKRITSVTKTFSIPFRPSAKSDTETTYIGSDGLPHNGLARTITFPISAKLPQDVVWSVSFNTNTSGPAPLGVASPTDSLNVGLSPTVRVGHDRFPGGIFWDTRYAENLGSKTAPFTLGSFGLDRDGWDGYVPAARFSTR